MQANRPSKANYSDILERIRNNLSLERNANKKSVKDKLSWYSRNQNYLDLTLLPIVESVYQPFACSLSRASDCDSLFLAPTSSTA